MTALSLDTIPLCRRELERTSDHMATLTQESTQVRAALSVVDEQMEVIEAIAAADVRGPDEKPTATEIKGRVVEFIFDDPELAPIREAQHSLRSELASLDRRLRTLEKRQSAAQSAINAHEAEAKYAGYGK